MLIIKRRKLKQKELDFIEDCVIKRLYKNKTFKLFNQKYNRCQSVIVCHYERIAKKLNIKGHKCLCNCGERAKPGNKFINYHNVCIKQKEINFIKECVIKRIYLEDTFKLFKQKYKGYGKGWDVFLKYYKNFAKKLGIKGHKCLCNCGERAKPGNKYIDHHNARGIEVNKKRLAILKRNKSWIYGDNHPMKNIKSVKKRQKTMKNKKLGVYGDNNPSKNPEIVKKMEATRKRLKIGFYRRINGTVRSKEEMVMDKYLLPLGFKTNHNMGTGNGGWKKYGCPHFQADFYNEEKNLVVELDGSSHLKKGKKETDARKDKFCKDNNIMILRFDMTKSFNPKKILKEIKKHL